jgi:flagellar hook-associated protein 1 FlgK
LAAVELRLSKSDAQLRATSGEIAGLITARDDILAGFLEELDAFAGGLIYEFNKIHASGQGLTGYDQVLSEQRIEDRTQPLDEAGLAFTPVHGSFQVMVINEKTGVHTTHDVFVQLSGMEDDTTLESLTATLDSIQGLSAEITLEGQLLLTAESSELQFSFANDTSGALAALGVNTFFTGTSAATMRVNGGVLDDVGKLAISRGGLGEDTHNGELLAELLTTPLDTDGGLSLAQRYERWAGETAQASALSQAVAEGYRAFHSTLEGEHLGLSGGSLDEEAVNLMTYQRNYQAAAKVISTISELLDILTAL